MANISRTKNTVTNTLCGFLNKIINIIFPFITRTIIIYVLGIEYVGLNSLFSSVLQVLNLAELGISSAVAYCMYKPLAEDDTEKICALLKYMKQIYRVIGMVVFGVGGVLIPFLPYLVNGEIPDDLNLVVLYLIYLLNSVIGYFFFAYKGVLLNAGQKNSIISNINSGIIFLQGISQIVMVYVFEDYYLFLIMMPIFTLLNNLWIGYATKKIYPQYVSKGELDTTEKGNIKTRVKGLFVTRICTTTRNAFDSIFISSFIGLSAVAIYGNYYYIMSAVTTMLNVITTAMTASVGNSLVKESIQKNYNDLRKFNFIFNWIVGFCTACLLLLFQPFMKLWMGQENIFPYETVVLCCLYFYFLNIGSIRAVYHDAAGLWWEARYRAIIEAVLNIVLNIVLTLWLGTFGTILGTLISLVVVNYIYGTQIVFKYYFKAISAKEYFLDNFSYSMVTLLICILLENIVSRFWISGIGEIVFRLVVCIIVFNLVYYLFFRKTKIFTESKCTVINLLHRGSKC